MFSQEDVDEILRAISSSQKLLPSEKSFIRSASGNRIFSQQYVKDGLQSIINDVEGRITFAEAAKRLDVDQKLLISHLLEEDGWGVSAQQIIPRKEFVGLWNILREQLADGLVQAWGFCKQNNINADIFSKLLRYQPVDDHEPLKWHWEGLDETTVYEDSFYEKQESEMEIALADLDSPLDLKSLAKDRDLPEALMLRIVTHLVKNSKIQGTLQGHTFIPEDYNVARQKELVDRFIVQGVIGVKELKQAGIEKSEEFVRQHVEARILKTNLVTEDFVRGILDMAKLSLEEEGFCEIKDSTNQLTVEEQAELSKKFRSEYQGRLLEYEGCLVSPSLVSKISELSISFVTNQAETALQTQLKKGQQSIDKSVNWNQLHQFLVSEFRRVPVRIIPAITKGMHSKVTSAYLKKLESLCKDNNAAAVEQFLEKTVARFEVHRQGLIALADRGLAEKLSKDLIDYHKDLLSDGLDKLERNTMDAPNHAHAIKQAKSSLSEALEDSTYTSEMKLMRMAEIVSILIQDISTQAPSPDMLENKSKEMLLELKKQTEKSTDNSLLLLITVIILHARETGNHGILRASGKYVPKLLKLLKSKIDDDVFAFLTKVKDSIVGKAQLTPDDIERLRQLPVNS